MFNNPSIWGENATCFDITRSLNKKTWNQEAFTPFSVPPRDCLGRHFAMMEMKVILLSILEKYDISIDTKTTKKGNNWATLELENGLILRFTNLDKTSLITAKL